MLRGVVALLIPLAACASDDSACERAAEHVAACFPDHPTAPVCDPDTAESITELSCNELAGYEGKSDNPWCFWTPWLCTGGSGTSGKKIEVSVEECGPGGLCPYVQSASCGLVTLHDNTGKQVAKGFTSGGGRLTFENIAAGTYTVKVFERDGSLARMMVSDYTDETATAKQTITLGSGDAPWARFNLTNGSAEALTQCANVRGNVTFTDAGGTPLDRDEMEWSWLVELETNGTIVDITRPLSFHPDENIVAFSLLQKGNHTIRYVRMDIPSYDRKINPDYARLRRLYSTDKVVEQTLSVTAAKIGTEIGFSRTIVDPDAN